MQDTREHARTLICLPMETKVRDFDARLYLAMKFSREGFPCVVGSRRDVREHMLAAGLNFIYIDKGGPKIDKGLALYRQIVDCGGAVMVLDEEGGIYKQGSKSLLARNNEAVLKTAELTFLWGPMQRDDLLAAFQDGIRDRIVVTGHPRFDLRKPAFGPFYKALGAASRGGLTDYILVNTSFGRANHQLDLERVMKGRRKRRGQWFDRDSDMLVYHYQKIVIHYFVEAVRRMSERFKDRPIVIRPHPVENVHFYKEQFRNLPNVTVVREGSVQEWITEALLVIHHTCTTSVEAFLYEKPVLSFLPIFDIKCGNIVPTRISDIARSCDELLAWVAGVVEHGGKRLEADVLQDRMGILGRILANVDFDAADRIVAAAIRKRPEIPFHSPASNAARQAALSEIRRKQWIRAIGRRTGLRALKNLKRTSIAKDKFPGLDSEEIEKRIELFRQVDPGLPRVRVTRAGENAFRLDRADATG